MGIRSRSISSTKRTSRHVTHKHMGDSQTSRVTGGYPLWVGSMLVGQLSWYEQCPYLKSSYRDEFKHLRARFPHTSTSATSARNHWVNRPRDRFHAPIR
ncbi:hypothetical protein PIB30_007008 [Stylosanthes scabra]|uniref:Uncharacterized protein n=1 Tax=Stylosanthes scabra TaxID=79078 RepID=A0ABU6Z446_9FABA|nr:hypothetical protein [Stylosanthes scabra]